jgi:hypothetical protein
MALINTLIRGHVYDFSSVEVKVDGKTLFCTFQEVNYNWSRDIGVLRGNGSAMKKARTRGEFNFEGSITLPKADAMEFQKLLAGLGLGGFGEAVFLLNVTYSDALQPKPHVDTLIGCTLTGGDDSHGRSPDPLVVQYNLDIMNILYDGISPASVDGGGGGIVGAIGGLLKI